MADWMENLSTLLKDFLSAAIPFKVLRQNKVKMIPLHNSVGDNLTVRKLSVISDYQQSLDILFIYLFIFQNLHV